MSRAYPIAIAVGCAVGSVLPHVLFAQPKPRRASAVAAIVAATDTAVAAVPLGLSIKNVGYVEVYVAAGRINCEAARTGHPGSVPQDVAVFSNQWIAEQPGGGGIGYWADLDADGLVWPQDIAANTNAWDAALKPSSPCQATRLFCSGQSQTPPVAAPVTVVKGTVDLACWRTGPGELRGFYYVQVKPAADGEIVLNWAAPVEIRFTGHNGTTLSHRTIDLRYPADLGRTTPLWLGPSAYRPWTLTGN